MSSRYRLAFITSLILPLSAGACASAPAHTTHWDAAEPTTHTFVIDNNSWHSLTVFVVRSGGAFHRLGRVESLQSGTFTVPAGFTLGSDVQLVGRSALAGAERPLSSFDVTNSAPSQSRNSGEYVTAPFALARAMRVHWIINNDARISQVFLR